MKCPMTFNDPCCDRDEECREDCAWLVESGTKRADKVCAIAVLASSGTEPMGFAPVNVIERSTK